MTSLSEVYEGGVSTVVDRRQRLVGMSIFAVGAAMVVGAIPIATTELASWLGLSVFEARQFAGILAGVGLPAVFVGIFVVLPASSATRAAAAIGASLAVFGVMLFSYVYPYQWISSEPHLALATTAIYSLGTLITFWCLFISVATFKGRNDPGGSARLEITEEGNIRLVTTESSIPGFGSVGLFGNEPDGAVPTQTNSDDGGTTDDEMYVPEPTSDGGNVLTDDASVDETVLEATETRGQPDRYCGNCEYFEYVRADGEITPYCGLDRRLMDDMEACDEWQQNT